MTSSPSFFTPFCDRAETLVVDSALVARFGLEQWAEQFKLGTAGYRDLLDPDDLFNPEVPFNGVTVAMVLEARAQLAQETGITSLHVGGEVRPHTQEFIDLAARIYAGKGINVHLRPAGMRTTPIWLSSFGVFYEELAGGENFTASHSPSFKGGWKPMDASGGQLLEMAGLIADRVRKLVTTAAEQGMSIELAAAMAPAIKRDFDPVEPYVAFLRQVVPAPLLAEMSPATENGFRAAFCTEGGSMGPTARRIFPALGIDVGSVDEDGAVFFTHEAESSDYHGIGVLDGFNHGVDPSKWQVYKHIGAQELLGDRKCDIVFIWDPDGDRFNMITTAPVALAGPAEAAGLEIDPLDGERCLVFFKPNQIYFLLTAAKVAALESAGELDKFNWIVATTYPTSRSIGEIAEAVNARAAAQLATFQVPVGFKHFAALVRDLEDQLARKVGQIGAVDVTDTRTEFGPDPRMLIMAEESGGAALGPAQLAFSRHGRRTSLAPKEKDAMQIGVLALCLAAKLHGESGSMAGFYLDCLQKYQTRYRFYERQDVTLFDESLQGKAREEARQAGNERKRATVEFFAGLEGLEPQAAAAVLRKHLTPGTELPPLQRVFHAGDGTFLEFEGQWFELRASGTDAVLRYYMEGQARDRVSNLNNALVNMKI